MRRIALGLVAAVLVAVLAPTAASTPISANVVSWSPADARAGEPVAITFALFAAPPDAKDVEVVIRGDTETRQFPTVDVGNRRYRTTITFPQSGVWHLRVRYRAEEIVLGKGAVRIDGPAAVSRRRPTSGTPPATVVGALLLLAFSALAVAASRSASRGSPALPG